MKAPVKVIDWNDASQICLSDIHVRRKQDYRNFTLQEENNDETQPQFVFR
jgi:hypothetical protein